MRRREFIITLGGVAATVAWPLVARAQVAGRTGIFEGLRHRGFIEGKNLTIVYRDFAPHADLLSEYAAELVKAQVDLIYGGGGTATHAAQQATKTIPILGFAEDMVGEGLVDSMARPNGNTTGISILATQSSRAHHITNQTLSRNIGGSGDSHWRQSGTPLPSGKLSLTLRLAYPSHCCGCGQSLTRFLSPARSKYRYLPKSA